MASLRGAASPAGPATAIVPRLIRRRPSLQLSQPVFQRQRILAPAQAREIVPHAVERQSGGRAARFTDVTRAPGCIGNVTIEISQRSMLCSLRRPVLRSVTAFRVRNPIERPSTAPSRISARISRARATARLSLPRTFRPRASSSMENHVPIGSLASCCHSIFTPVAPRCAAAIPRKRPARRHRGRDRHVSNRLA